MNLVNLTPHVIRLHLASGVREIPSAGVLRLTEEIEPQGDIDGIPLVSKRLGAADELPPRERGTCYIVSLPAAQACCERQDFLIPDDYIRDEGGRIVGCRRLARVVGPTLCAYPEMPVCAAHY